MSKNNAFPRLLQIPGYPGYPYVQKNPCRNFLEFLVVLLLVLVGIRESSVVNRNWGFQGQIGCFEAERPNVTRFLKGTAWEPGKSCPAASIRIDGKSRIRAITLVPVVVTATMAFLRFGVH
eukprot:1181421-Rhodomonas_salina.2